MTQVTLTVVATGPGGTGRASTNVQVADAPVPGEIVFNEGVPSSVDVSALLPAVADRFTGGYYSRQAGVYSDDDHIPGVTFNAATRKIDYDGSLLNSSGVCKNPNSSYFLGWETGPYNDHWQYPPRTINIPQPVGGKIQAINGGSKHTRPRFCPWDNKIWIHGGDYSSAGVITDLHQDGRMLLWIFDPVANTWGYAYPPLGRVGEEQPLSPDIMGPSWDKTREIWWISWGDSRAGVQSEAHWKSLGGQSDTWPKSATVDPILDAPVFTFDPKVPNPKYKRCCFQPWNILSPKMREAAYDDTTKRLYKLQVGSVASIRAWWLDTTLYETDPMAMPWSFKDIDLAAGKPDNLTGSGAHQYATGFFESPCHIDELKRLLYFVDSRTGAVLGMTLQGHPQGAHKVKLIANLPGMPNLATSPMGLLACASMPFVWIEQHRKIVMMVEPLWEEVGPLSNSFTIDVDSGAVTEGPRFPELANGKPWFPAASVWFPPTQELICYGYYPNTSLPYLTPQTMHAYKWSP